MIFCISCAHLHERVDGSATLHRACQEARDAAVLPRIERLVAKRPPHGYRRITAVLNREGPAAGLPPTAPHGALKGAACVTRCCAHRHGEGEEAFCEAHRGDDKKRPSASWAKGAGGSHTWRRRSAGGGERSVSFHCQSPIQFFPSAVSDLSVFLVCFFLYCNSPCGMQR